MKSGKASKKDKKVFVASKDVFDVQPVVYSFRVADHGPASDSVMTAIRPPNWLYHDHAFGVIWMLFHHDKNYIGISQLHWCLRFLLELKNSQGEYTGDVEICIQAIQDDLIEQYAKLGTVLEKSMEEKSTRKSKDVKADAVEPVRDVIKNENEETTENSKVNQLIRMKQERPEDENFNEEIRPEDNNFNEAKPEDENFNEEIRPEDNNFNQARPEDENLNEEIRPEDNNFNQARPEDENLNEDIRPKDENFATEMNREETGTSSPIKKEEPGPSESPEPNKDKKDSGEKCNLIKCGNSGQRKDEIISFTYNGMISGGPFPCIEEYSIDNLFDENMLFDQSNEKTKDEIMENGDRPNLADASTKEMVKFLNSSRQQHIERIKKEIERLYGLERFMENLNANEFSAYVTEDLAKRMESLKNEEIVKKADEITR